ncbi:MAG: MFS transporter [Proteobacteria bacterium]|jgi:PAT family beta-lactamase induction signal transducer AmpG|nr:MFS transporter [Pseudomonadota bacterium]
MRSFHRLVFIWILGFASGLPLALTGTTLQAWMTVDGIDLATIGFLSLVGLPYTFKFLWAPLMDRFEPPFFKRRKGWLLITQLLLALVLFGMSTLSPSLNIQAFGLMAVLIAFLSASQDIVIDAYRTDVLQPEERGLGSSLTVFGYRLAMILSSGIALMWADTNAGYGWSWPEIYRVMGIIMICVAGLTFLALPNIEEGRAIKPTSDAKKDLLGFFALTATAFAGYYFTSYFLDPVVKSIYASSLPEGAEMSSEAKKWLDLISLLIGLGVTLPAAWWVSKKIQFETLNRSLQNYFSMKGAIGFLGFIILYKLGDAFAGSLLTPFLLKGVGFTQAEIGVLNKVIGIWLTIFGAIAGGALMMRLGLYRSLMLFGGLQLISNFGFYIVSVLEKGSWGGFTLPVFDLLIVSLKEPTNVDHLLLFAVSLENITGGMGTAAFVAFLMALCHQKFTATQYALLSAFSAIGRVWVGPLSGVLAISIGWPTFFLFSAAMAAPGLYLLYRLRDSVKDLEAPQGVSSLDD